ncbi:hypothetical protein [Pseudomonas huanghezhanensis]|uniref:hypothetical protein n=1 Tax=Pseudomonas huanghezhanensis TaxID=3002903 RepID=UPI00228610A5|nr:hypothetical protein [Pseudomonas sp. BSw22131]
MYPEHIQQDTPLWQHPLPTFAQQDDSEDDSHFGGDQSPLNDADADEDSDPEGELDLTDLGLDEFGDADKLDIGSASLR